MRKLKKGSHRYTEVVVIDEPGPGGACHQYCIGRAVSGNKSMPECEYGRILFQLGPVLETGVNGCFMEDLIAICIDRLEAFQAGEFNCHENAAALDSLKSALYSLNQRTRDRQFREVEGKTVK